MRAVWAASVLIALLVAGCGAPPDAHPSPATRTGPTLPPMGTPRVLPAVIIAAVSSISNTLGDEPLAVTDMQGGIYAFAPLNDVLARSDDGGRSYTILYESKTRSGQPVPSDQDGAILAAPDGSIAISGLYRPSNALGGRGGTISVGFNRSDDRGASWRPGTLLANGSNLDRQWLASGRPGHILALWRDRNDPQDIFIALRTSIDGGRTWSAAKRIHSGDVLPGPLLAGADGVSYYFAYSDAFNNTEVVQRTRDEGQHWENVKLGQAEGAGPVIAQDAEGTLYVAATHVVASGPVGAVLWVSHDKGDTWSTPLDVGHPSRDVFLPWIIAGAKGRVALAWYEDAQGATEVSRAANLWRVAVVASDDADSSTPHFQRGTTPEVVHVGGLGSTRHDTLGFTLANDGAPIIIWVKDSADPNIFELASTRVEDLHLR